MSYMNKSQKPSAMSELASRLKTELDRTGGGSPEAVRAGLGMEAMNDTYAASLNVTHANCDQLVRATMKELNMSVESFSTAQIDSATAIAMAYADPSAYLRKATDTSVVGGTGIKTFNSSNESLNGFLDGRDVVYSGEAFDKTVLTKYIGYSIAFNLGAARQDEASEALFPTYVVTPDQGGIDIVARIQTVMNEAKHSVTGKTTDFAQKKLLDAFVDPTILAADSLICVPYFQTGTNSSAAYFVDTAKIPTRVETVEGVGVTTTALKVGTSIDLLGISSHPTLMNNQILNNTDSLSGQVMLNRVYVAFQSGTVNEEIVAFDVRNLQRTSFIKSVEGRDQEMNLVANGLDLIVATGINDKDIGNGPLAVFSGFATAQQVLRLQVSLSGAVDIEYGSITVNASNVTVASVSDRATGGTLDLTSGAVQTNITALGKIEVLGYDVIARRTNSNRRTRGLQGNVQVITERHQIPLGSPLSMPSSLTETNQSLDIEVLTTMGRARNSNMAMTKLLDTADLLNAYVSTPIKDVTPNIQGIGRYYMNPYFKRQVAVDYASRVNSIETHNRLADLKAAMVSDIRNQVLQMMQGSHYKIAMDQITGFSGRKLKVLIVTDQELGAYLMVDGDSRTLGQEIEVRVVVSYDKRLAGRIFMTFDASDIALPNPLTFGLHAWVPEMTSCVPVTRDGAVVQESMVQPRNTHIILNPVLAEIQVDMEKFREVATEKTDAPQVLP